MHGYIKEERDSKLLFSSKWEAIEQVKQFSYLGSILTSDGRYDTEIKRIRIENKSLRSSKYCNMQKEQFGNTEKIMKVIIWSQRFHTVAKHAIFYHMDIQNL